MSFPGLSTYAVTLILAVCYLAFLKILLDRKILTVQAGVVFGLAGIVVFLEVFSLVSRSIPSPVLQWLFDPDKEKNLISTYSSMLLFLTSIPALLIGLRSPRQDSTNWPTAIYWTLFGVIFLFLAFDEYFLFHERLHNWHLIYAIFGGSVAAVTAVVAWFFDRGRLRLYALIFFALACIGGGGIGFDLPGSPIPFSYVFRITIEEFLEMIGSSLILFATLTYLDQYSTPARWRLNARLLPVMTIL